MLPQPLGAGLVQHFRSPLPPYRCEDLRFLSEIEDRDQPALPIDDMERDAGGQVVAVALANRMARTAWALMVHGGTYRAPELAEAA